jgi:hypothetical protein
MQRPEDARPADTGFGYRRTLLVQDAKRQRNGVGIWTGNALAKWVSPAKRVDFLTSDVGNKRRRGSKNQTP